MGAMNLLMEDGEVEHAGRIAVEIVRHALREAPERVKRTAGLPLQGEAS